MNATAKELEKQWVKENEDLLKDPKDDSDPMFFVQESDRLGLLYSRAEAVYSDTKNGILRSSHNTINISPDGKLPPHTLINGLWLMTHQHLGKSHTIKPGDNETIFVFRGRYYTAARLVEQLGGNFTDTTISTRVVYPALSMSQKTEALIDSAESYHPNINKPPIFH